MNVESEAAGIETEVNGRMTFNIASPVFNTLVLAFFVVVLLGAALGAYAASAMKKQERKD